MMDGSRHPWNVVLPPHVSASLVGNHWCIRLQSSYACICMGTCISTHIRKRVLIRELFWCHETEI